MFLSNYNKKMAFYILVAVFFMFLDRIFKKLAVKLSIELFLIKDFFVFTLEKNKYIAFSLPISGIILNIVIIITILLLIYFLFVSLKKQRITIFAALFFVVLGAVSNLIDRLNYGFVIDYFYLKHFTVFNIADCMIVLGAMFLVYFYMIKEKN